MPLILAKPRDPTKTRLLWLHQRWLFEQIANVFHKKLSNKKHILLGKKPLGIKYLLSSKTDGSRLLSASAVAPVARSRPDFWGHPAFGPMRFQGLQNLLSSRNPLFLDHFTFSDPTTFSWPNNRWVLFGTPNCLPPAWKATSGMPPSRAL